MVRAQTTIYWDGSASNSWATAANFNTQLDGLGADVAVGTATQNVVFTISSGAQNLLTNLAANRSILSLAYNGSSAPSTIANNVLTIASGGITLSSSGASHLISSTITAGANQTWTVPTGRTLTVAAVNDPTVGDSNIILTGGGIVLLTASGSVNKWDVRGSILRLNGSARLGDTTTSVDLDSTATLDFTNFATPETSFSDAFRGLNGATGSTVLNYGSTAAANLDLRPQAANETYRFSGNFVGTGTAASIVTQGLTAFGTQIIEADFPGRANVQVLNGNLVFGAALGAANLATGSIVVGRADASTQAPGTVNMLVLDSSAANHVAQNRLDNAEQILLRTNGQFKVIGNSVAATTEDVGAIRSEISNNIHPHVVLTLEDGGKGVELRSDALEHNQRTTLLVRGNGLGTGALGAGVTRLIFDAVPLQGSGAGIERGSIPYLVGDNSPTGLGTDFVTHDSNGLRLLTAGEYASGLNNTAASNVNLTANVATSTSSTNLALKFSGGVTLSVGANDTVTVNSGRIATGAGSVDIASGAILSVGGTPNRITGGKLTFGAFDLGTTTGPHEGYIHALTDFTLDSTVTNNGTAAVSLSKSGLGTLTISKPQTYTGETTITQGNVVVTGAHFLPAGRTNIANTLTLSGLPSDSVGNIGGALGTFLNIGATKALEIKGGGDTNWWGTVQSSTSAVALTKSGAGTVTFRTAAGFAPFNGGPLVVAGGGIQFFEPGPTASASPSVTIRGAGTLNVNNGLGNDSFANQNRIGDTAPVTIERGTFIVTGSNNARVTENIGILTLDTGLGFFTIDADDGTTNSVVSSTQGDVILSTPSLLRLNKASIYVRGEIGQDLNGRPDGNAAGGVLTPDTTGAEGAFRVAAAPALSHAAANFGTTTAAVLPWGTGAFGSGAVVATASGLLTYDTNDGDSGVGGIQHIGFRPLAANEYATVAPDVASTLAAALVLNQNARITFAAPSSASADITLAENTTVRGLVVNNVSTSSSDLNLDTRILTVESGVLISIGTQDVQLIGNSTAGAALTFGPNAATGYDGRIDGQRRIDIDVPVKDNGTNPVSLITDGTVYMGFRYDSGEPDLAGYTGATQINSGRIELKLANTLPRGTVLTIADSAELRLNNQDQEIAGLKGAGFVGNENNTGTNESQITINVPQNQTYDFRGTIRNRSVFTTVEGGLTLVKKGRGTQILSGVNTMTGDSVGGVSGRAAAVENGTLLVNGSLVGRVANDPTDQKANVSVDSTTFDDLAVLGGTGLVNGEVALSGFGTLAPGSNGIGTFTLGSLRINGQFTGVRFELTTPGVIGGGVNDFVNVLGDIAIDGYLEVYPGPGFGQGTYRLFNYGGTFSSAPGGFILDNPFYLPSFPGSFVDYSTPGQINLVVAVPEPGAAIGLLSGAGLLLGSRRRRKGLPLPRV